jgi:hypothetical protein
MTSAFLDEIWSSADREGLEWKDSERGRKTLGRFITSLHGQDRQEAEATLAQWIFSAEPRRRFDALATIETLKLRSALPALRMLARELEDSAAPSGPYDWAWVNRIIGRLSVGSG